MNHQTIAVQMNFEEYAAARNCSVEEARKLFWEHETAFTQDIRTMNRMYSLPTPEKPEVPTLDRLNDYRDILLEELGELDLLRAKVACTLPDEQLDEEEADNLKAHQLWLDEFKEMSPEKRTLDILADFADFNCDLQVYAASENCKHGIPNNLCMEIVMSSNFSKLGPDGQPIHDERGKFLKGPNYWKPEPKLKELLETL